MTTNSAVDELQSMGPVDFLVIEYPEGRMTGEAYPYLVSLIDTGTIYILDIAFAIKETDGSMRQLAFAELPGYAQMDVKIFQGASSGMLGPSDLNEVNELLRPGSIAVVVVFENLWAAPFAAALRRSGAQLLAHGRIPVTAMLSALSNAESSHEGVPQPIAEEVPGLLRGIARTAVVAAQAVAVSNRIARLREGQWAERDIARAVESGAYTATSEEDSVRVAVAQLKQLARMTTEGRLSESEFEAQVSNLLTSNMAYAVRPTHTTVSAGS